MPCAHPRRRTERGSVTAETAVVLPALLVLLAAVGAGRRGRTPALRRRGPGGGPGARPR